MPPHGIPGTIFVHFLPSKHLEQSPMAGRQLRLGWRSCGELSYHAAMARHQARMRLSERQLSAGSD